MLLRWRHDRIFNESKGHVNQPALGTAWERRTTRTATFGAVATAVVVAALGFALRESSVPLWFTLPTAAILGLVVHSSLTRKVRRRR